MTNESDMTPAEGMAAKKVAELKRLAEAATPGPWYVQYGDDDRFMSMAAISQSNARTCNIGPFDDCAPLVAVTFHQCYPHVNCERSDLGDANSAFIAAANPQTVLALIETVQSQAAELAGLRAGAKWIPEEKGNDQADS